MLSGCWISWIMSVAAQKDDGQNAATHASALHVRLHPRLAEIHMYCSGRSPAPIPESAIQRGEKGSGARSRSLWQHPQKCFPDVSCTKMLAGLQMAATEGLTIVTQRSSKELD